MGRVEGMVVNATRWFLRAPEPGGRGAFEGAAGADAPAEARGAHARRDVDAPRENAPERAGAAMASAASDGPGLREKACDTIRRSRDDESSPAIIPRRRWRAARRGSSETVDASAPHHESSGPVVSQICDWKAPPPSRRTSAAQTGGRWPRRPCRRPHRSRLDARGASAPTRPSCRRRPRRARRVVEREGPRGESRRALGAVRAAGLAIARRQGQPARASRRCIRPFDLSNPSDPSGAEREGSLWLPGSRASSTIATVNRRGLLLAGGVASVAAAADLAAPPLARVHRPPLAATQPLLPRQARRVHPRHPQHVPHESLVQVRHHLRPHPRRRAADAPRRADHPGRVRRRPLVAVHLQLPALVPIRAHPARGSRHALLAAPHRVQRFARSAQDGRPGLQVHRRMAVRVGGRRARPLNTPPPVPASLQPSASVESRAMCIDARSSVSLASRPRTSARTSCSCLTRTPSRCSPPHSWARTCAIITRIGRWSWGRCGAWISRPCRRVRISRPRISGAIAVGDKAVNYYTAGARVNRPVEAEQRPRALSRRDRIVSDSNRRPVLSRRRVYYVRRY